MKPYRIGLVAGLIAGALAVSACSSSKSNNSTSSTAGSSAAAAPTCSTGKLNGAGSTAQGNAMTAWTTAYQKACSGATINYNGTGSGAGVTSFNAGQVDFAGSDAALNASAGEVTAAQKRCSSTPLNLPMVVGPIALAYNLSGVSKLILTGDVTAKIFLGKITTWNDAAISALNPGATLPSTKITPVYRSDSSGTTKNFENWLSATAPTVFTSAPDKDSSKAGFAGVGKSGSTGVAAAVTSTPGAIGYVEYSYAVSGGLSTAEIDNGGGAVELSPATASAAALSATVVGTGSDLSLKLDYATKTPGAYPVILVTYEIVCTKYTNSSTGTFVKNFLNYTSTGGQAGLPALGYAPLPAGLQTKVQASVATIS